MFYYEHYSCNSDYYHVYLVIKRGGRVDVQNHITRLSRYKSIVKQFKAIGMTRIFAKNIADAGHLKPAQVRKDFYIFDITGNKKGGCLSDRG